MKRKKRIGYGDVLAVPCGDGLSALVQIVSEADVMLYVMAFDRRVPDETVTVSAEVLDAISEDPRLTFVTTDGKPATEDWRLLGNAGVLCDVPFPVGKVRSDGEWLYVNVFGEPVCTMDPDLSGEFDYSHSQSTGMVDAVITASFGEGPWYDGYNTCLPPARRFEEVLPEFAAFRAVADR